MMRTVVRRARFSDELNQLRRRGKNIEELLDVVDILAEFGELPDAYSPHMLTGDWKGVWECHIEPDWLLIYLVTDREVILLRTGTHSDLFG